MHNGRLKRDSRVSKPGSRALQTRRRRRKEEEGDERDEKERGAEHYGSSNRRAASLGMFFGIAGEEWSGFGAAPGRGGCGAIAGGNGAGL
jgi:hypothetical protein